MNKLLNYTELSKLKTFDERFAYLKLKGIIGVDTFGSNRYLNQKFYTSEEWQAVRDEVIRRDLGCNLGIDGLIITKKQRLFVHHMNPITDEDILNRNPAILDPEFLICCSFKTHNAIHFGEDDSIRAPFRERTRFDTCPWKRGD